MVGTVNQRTNCRSCEDPLDPRRVELGYDYCTKPDCQRRCMRGVELASVAVNKAADQYVRADEVVRRGPGPRWGIDEIPEGSVPASRPLAPPKKKRRRRTTGERLRAAERELDDRVRQSYERFCRGEITAAEMKAEQNSLISAFNDQVRAANIRYRSFLRKLV
jgi:hypothetical protein